MARIKIQDYINDVELNRRSLINHCRENGIAISDNASLSTVVGASNSLEVINKPHLVRFFDCDGTILKQEYINDGGSIIPPQNPNFDPERLTFERWCSAIGNRFDNIQHDVDYMAKYLITDGFYYLFCVFNEYTSYTVTLPQINLSTGATTFTIDWGDGSELETYTQTMSGLTHTYSEGSFILKISSDRLINKQDNYIYFSQSLDLLSNSDISQSISGALKYMYLPIMNDNVAGSYMSHVIHNCLYEFIVFNECNSMSENFAIKNFIMSPEIYTGTSAPYVHLDRVTNLIVDIGSKGASWSSSNIRTYLDKLILPSSVIESPNAGSGIFGKIIALGNNAIAIPGNSVEYHIYSNASITSMENAQSVKFINHSDNVITLNGKIGNKNLISLHIPKNVIIQKSIFSNCYGLQNFTIDSEISCDLYLGSCYSLNSFSIVNILNKISGQHLIHFSNQLFALVSQLYVKINDFGIFEKCHSTDTNAIQIISVFNQKGWTVSFGY